MVRETPSQFNLWENRLLIQFDPDGGTDSEHFILLVPVIARFDIAPRVHVIYQGLPVIVGIAIL